MRIDELNNRHITASEGKVLRRITDGWIAGNDVYLGYAYIKGGEKLIEPLLELPEHYEEIVPLDEVIDEEFDVAAEPEVLSLLAAEGSPIVMPEKITLADLLSHALTEIEGLKKEVSELKTNQPGAIPAQ